MKKLLLIFVMGAAVLAVGAAAFFALGPGDDPVVTGGGPAGDGTEPRPEPVEEGKIRIAGTVEDEQGKPVTGAFVYLLSKGDPLVPPVGPRHRRSDAVGAFSLEKKEEKDLDLLAISPGFRPTVIEHASGDGLRVVLSRGGTIRGKVLDDQGRPIVGAKITARTSGSEVAPPRGIYLPHHATLFVTYMRTISGMGGAFVIHGVGEGEVDLVAGKRTHPELLRPWRGAAAGEAGVKLVLLRPFTASVAVVDSEKNEPIVSAGVVIEMPDEKGGMPREIRGRTNRRGEMTKTLPFPAARAPDLRVKVTAGTEDYGSVVAEGVPLSKLEVGEGFTLRLTKQEPAILLLTIRYDTGKPYRNWIFFEVEPAFGDEFHRWSRIDKDGAASIKVPPGHYKAIRPRASGEIDAGELTNLKLDAAEEYEHAITITRGGDLHLTVTVGEKQAARGAKVTVGHPGGKIIRTIWGTTIHLNDIPPGLAIVTVEHEGHETVIESITLVKDEKRDLKITLRPTPKKK